jgi:hypothetical protein
MGTLCVFEIERWPGSNSGTVLDRDTSSRGSKEEPPMHFLYGSKKGVERRLVATFGSEQQLLAYVRWATLESFGDRQGKFEQGSALASYDAWEHSPEALTSEDASAVLHNPTPSML